jgi:hypothetical protein
MEMSTAITPPAIGQKWPGQGGIYAGLVRGRDGAPDTHLIVGPELPRSGWVAAGKAAAGKAAAGKAAAGKAAAGKAAAEVSVDGHTDFTLPFRAEQAVMFGNVPELFEAAWYWSCERHDSFPACAWVQGFGSGTQNNDPKSNQGRARAVRRFEKI